MNYWDLQVGDGWLIVLFAVGVLLFLATTFGVPSPRLKYRPKVEQFRCRQSCEDRLCQRYGCPEDPSWEGDRK